MQVQQQQIFLPTEYPDYSSRQFWETRYQSELTKTFDGSSDEWYVSYPQIESIVKSRLYEDKDTEIMIVGCGTSELGAHLYKDGFHYITNVDYSKNLIEHMREKHQEYEEMDYVLMDITEQNEIVEESFNCVIDKGTFDCIACCEDGSQKKIESMLENVYRILAPGGCYICVSRGSPETRLLYLHS